jgi:hypothetical protein
MSYEAQMPKAEQHNLPEQKQKVNEQEKSLLEKFRKIFRTKLGRLALCSLGLLSLRGDQKLSRIEIDNSFDENQPSVTYTLPDQSQITSTNWSQISLDTIDDSYIKPQSDIIQHVVDSKNDMLTRVGFYPIKISDPEIFNDWLIKQLNNPEILNTVGIKKIEDAEPKQLIELALVIVNSNLSYDSENIEEKIKSANGPIDKLLMNSLPAECEHYAVATEVVFNTLKKNIYPDKLKNAYINSIPTRNLSHVYNQVTIITGDKSTEIAILDPTAMDIAYGAEYIAEENFIDTLDEWKDNQIIDARTYFSLAYAFLASADNIPPEQIGKFIFSGTFFRDVKYTDQNTVKVINTFIEKTSNENDIKKARIILEQTNIFLKNKIS